MVKHKLPGYFKSDKRAEWQNTRLSGGHLYLDLFIYPSLEIVCFLESASETYTDEATLQNSFSTLVLSHISMETETLPIKYQTVAGKLTSVHSRFQAHKQVGKSSLPRARKVVYVASVLLQVTFAGLCQGITDFVILCDQLLPSCQCITTLRRTSILSKWKAPATKAYKEYGSLGLARDRGRSRNLNPVAAF